MTTLRKLDELSCKQLKEELRARELRIFCAKEKMRERLRQALLDEDEDPDSYLFEVQPDIRELMNTVTDQMNSFQVQLKEVNEQICTMIKQIGISTSLNKTDDTFDTVMSKTDDQMATMSTGINNPLLNGDAVDGGAVYDCNSEPCNLGSYDKNPNICCESTEHRSDHAIVIPAYTQTLNNNCDDRTSSKGEFEHRKTCQLSICPDTSISKRSADGGTADGHIGRCKRAPQICLSDKLKDYTVFDNLASWGPTAHRESLLEQRVRQMVLMTYAMTSTASLLAMSLPSVVTKRKARQRKRLPLNQRQVNWSRRRKRHLQRAVWIALWGARSMQSVTPTDRPPPALANREHVSFRDEKTKVGVVL